MTATVASTSFSADAPACECAAARAVPISRIKPGPVRCSGSPRLIQVCRQPSPALDAAKIEEAIVTLQKRVDERFPNRGLSKLCAQLHSIAREDRERLAWVARPNLWLGGGVAIAFVVV